MKQLTPYKLREHITVFIHAHMLMGLFFAVVSHICEVRGPNPGLEIY